MCRHQSIRAPRRWQNAISRASDKGVNRVTRHWSHTEPGTTETFFRGASATAEGQTYAVRVFERRDDVSTLCTCDCGYQGSHPCWHMAAALMMLGYLADTSVAVA